MRCLDCEHHAVVGGKIDCNYMNRLGLAQPKVQTFMVDAAATDPAKLDAMMKDMEEQEKHIKEQMEKLAELKKLSGSVGGDSSG